MNKVKLVTGNALPALMRGAGDGTSKVVGRLNKAATAALEADLAARAGPAQEVPPPRPGPRSYTERAEDTRAALDSLERIRSGKNAPRQRRGQADRARPRPAAAAAAAAPVTIGFGGLLAEALAEALAG